MITCYKWILNLKPIAFHPTQNYSWLQSSSPVYYNFIPIKKKKRLKIKKINNDIIKAHGNSTKQITIQLYSL